MPARTCLRFALISGLWMALAFVPAMADGSRDLMRRDGRTEIDLDQDQILEAAKRGEARPLEDIAAAAKRAMPGQVVRVKVKRLAGRLVYEFKVVTDSGRVREVYIDAATLDIVKVE